MSTELFVLLLLGAVVVVYVGMILVTYVRMRGKRVVTCPETKAPVAVAVDAGHAAFTAVWENPDIRLKSCTRWPERQDCDQGCTAQIALTPGETLASNILKRWYAGRNCAMCKRPIAEIHAGAPKPGLLNVPASTTMGWDEIPVESLSAILESHVPICSNCYVAETFRQQFPDRVTDRAPTDKRDLVVH